MKTLALWVLAFLVTSGNTTSHIHFHMFSYPINSNCCSSCVSLRKRFYIPPSQWIVIDGTFSRTVGYNHIVSSGTTVYPIILYHQTGSAGQEWEFYAQTSWVARPVFQSVGILPGFTYFRIWAEDERWEWEDMIRSGHGSSNICSSWVFAVFRSCAIITYRPTQPAMLPSGQSQVFIGPSRCSRSCMASTSPPAITSLFALSGTAECIGWKRLKTHELHVKSQKSKVESWKSKVEVQCWVETNFDSRPSFSLLQSQSLCNSTLIIYHHLSENNEKGWIETIMSAFILWSKSKSYATRPLWSPQCGSLWTTYSNPAPPFSNISIKCGQDINI